MYIYRHGQIQELKGGGGGGGGGGGIHVEWGLVQCVQHTVVCACIVHSVLGGLYENTSEAIRDHQTMQPLWQLEFV